MEKNKLKKIGVVVPTELDFVRAIRLEYQIPDRVPLPDRVCDDDISEIREGFAFKVMSAGRRLSHKFTEVLHEFPNVYRLDPLYASLLHQRYNMDHYDRAVSEVSHAQEMVDAISGDYVKLLLKDDCDSRDKCKSLRVTFAKRSIPALAFLDKGDLIDNGDCDSLEKFKRLEVNALGCMYTVAMRCMPSLAYLEKVRQYIASLPDSCLEFENNAAASTLRKTKCDAILADEDCTFPLAVDVDVHNVADFVHPDVLSWLDELVRENGPRIRDDQLDFAKQSHNPKEHLATVSSMKSLVI
ncbi:unnamed protein product [Arabidopsis lyrata]|nr:unnamed protein product [Arabidopsis lyrata]